MKDSYTSTLLKLALEDIKTLQSPHYTDLVSSTVRMPGPEDKQRSFMGSTTFTPESEKRHAQDIMDASSKVGKLPPTPKIEGIN